MRRVLSIPMAISLALLVATAALWVRSYWKADALYIGVGGRNVLHLGSGVGRLSVEHYRNWPPPLRFHFRTYTVGDVNDVKSAVFAFNWPPAGAHRSETTYRDFKMTSGETAVVVKANGAADFDSNALTLLRSFSSQHFSSPMPFLGIRIPFWPIAIVAGIIPTLNLIRTFFRQARRAIRRSNGRCCQCGYDIRATPDCCPECGTQPTKKNYGFK